MKALKFVSAIFLFSMAATASYADGVSMDFVSVGGNTYGSYYTYPYNFSINGSSTLTPLMCVSFNNEVYLGETWTASMSAITSASSLIAQEDAYLFSMIGQGYSTNDVQEAVWYLSASPSTKSSVGAPSNDVSLANAAAGIVNSADLSKVAPSWDNGQYVMYTPMGNFAPGQTPQSYIGMNAISQTPEPSTLALLGTGLFGAAGALYRKRKQDVQA